MHLVNQDIYSVLFDYELKIVVCTTLSAQSIGLERWGEARGLSFWNYANTDVAKIFFRSL